MTSTEFEKQYAERSGSTVARLRELGRVVLICLECDYEDCEGFVSVSKEAADDYLNHPMYAGRYEATPPDPESTR